MQPKKRWHPGLKQDIITFAENEPEVTKDIQRQRTTWPYWVFAAVSLANLLSLPLAYLIVCALRNTFPSL